MSAITIRDVEEALDRRELAYPSDTTQRHVQDAVDNAFSLIRWQRLNERDAFDFATDQLGDDLFCNLTDQQAARLNELVDSEITNTVRRMWLALKGAVAIVAVQFHQEQPDAPLRADNPRDDDVVEAVTDARLEELAR